MGTAKLRGLENASGHRISVQGDLGILENLDERKTQWKKHQFYTELREKKKPLVTRKSPLVKGKGSRKS